MKTYKSLLLGAVAASVFAAGAMITPAQAGNHSNKKTAELGHKKGAFYLKSTDGNYTAYTGFKFQFDSNFDSNDDDFVAGGVADTHEFKTRRIHFSVKGRAGSKALTYGIAFNVEGGSFIDGSIQYKYNKLLAFKVGNYKALGISAGNRTSSSTGWGVDDPVNFGAVASGRNVGASVLGNLTKELKYEVKVSQGGGSGVETASEGISLNVGLSYEPFGRFGGFNQADYNMHETLRMVFHGGYQYDQDSTGHGRFATYAAAAAGTRANLDYYHMMVGAKYAGLGLTAAYEHGNFQDDTADGSLNHNGLKAQGIVLAATYMVIPKKVPLAVTYSYSDGDTENGANGDINGGSLINGTGIVRQWGVGAQYLFNGHKNKLHASWDRTSTQVNLADVGTGANNSNKDIDQTVKFRWQLLF